MNHRLKTEGLKDYKAITIKTNNLPLWLIDEITKKYGLRYKLSTQEIVMIELIREKEKPYEK